MAKLLKDLLPNFASQSRSSETRWKQYLLQNWNSIIGDLQTHVQLEKIVSDNTLILGVQDPAWMQELYLLSPMIIRKINEKLDKPHVKQLRFKCSPEKKKLSDTKTVHQAIQPTIKLTAQEQRALEKITDTELKNALRNFLIRCHKEK